MKQEEPIKKRLYQRNDTASFHSNVNESQDIYFTLGTSCLFYYGPLAIDHKP
jgi:hypothetical protein